MKKETKMMKKNKKGFAAGGSTRMKKKGFAGGGMMKKKGYAKGGQLKAVDVSKNPGLAKLPEKVRNNMGFMKNGGSVKKKKGMAAGGMMKKKGMAAGGMMKKKGFAKGGMMKKKGFAGGGKIQGTPSIQVKGTTFKGVY